MWHAGNLNESQYSILYKIQTSAEKTTLMINKNEYTYVDAIFVLIFSALETTNFVVDIKDLWSTESF